MPTAPPRRTRDRGRPPGQTAEGWRQAEPLDAIEGAVPLGLRVDRRAGPGWLLVGDAAGFLDPFTGEGLHRAFVSAELGADAVLATLRGDREALARYDRSMRARFRAKDLVSLVVQGFLGRPRLFDYAARRLAARERERRVLELVMGDLVPASAALDPASCFDSSSHDRPMTTRDYVTYVGAYGICLDAEDRLLLARIRDDTPDDGRWTHPGGGLEYGETPEAGVRREIEEETGLIGEPEAILGTSVMTIDRSASFEGRRLHFVGILYRVRIVGGRLRDEVNGTTDACGWFDRDAIADLPLVWLVERDALRLAFPDGDG